MTTHHAQRVHADAQYIPATALADEFGVTRRTIGRWFVNPEMEFPTPVQINRRLYFRRTDIDAWKDRQVRASLATKGGH